jgi:LytS/YehU family sensor histidine kinase
MLEPLLLIPFVENAFKHGIGHGDDPVIVIRLHVNPERLQFDVENRIFRSDITHLPAEPGMGLKNVKRRLELLYPGKHELKITDEGDRFRAELVILMK